MRPFILLGLFHPRTIPAVTYHPGQRIPIILALGEVPGVTKVHYFWYGEDEDMLKELVEQN